MRSYKQKALYLQERDDDETQYSWFFLTPKYSQSYIVYTIVCDDYFKQTTNATVLEASIIIVNSSKHSYTRAPYL